MERTFSVLMVDDQSRASQTVYVKALDPLLAMREAERLHPGKRITNVYLNDEQRLMREAFLRAAESAAPAQAQVSPTTDKGMPPKEERVSTP